MAYIPRRVAEHLEQLYAAFAQLQTPEDVAQLMGDLCTDREIDEMAQRLSIAAMLAEGGSYLEIQRVTGVSTTTIARVSRCLVQGSGGYRLVLGEASE
ncbi:MAG: YerC/YecD family TrpR-related protein [Actinomycetia bacterium]|nr:YerC/YecD family TrpR-related protein [Actinomycetes bacterium]